MYLPRTQPASLWPEWVCWGKKKEEMRKKIKACTKLTVWESNNFISGKGVVTTCASDANLCLPYQHVNHKVRLIIHKVSCGPRRVNHSSACMFVTIVMEIKCPRNLQVYLCMQCSRKTLDFSDTKWWLLMRHQTCKTIICYFYLVTLFQTVLQAIMYI